LAKPHFEGLRDSYTLTRGEAVLHEANGSSTAPLTPNEYRKTATIQAVQINEDFTVNSEEGTLYATAGDWLAEGPAGELWSIKKDIFEQTYVPAEDEQEADFLVELIKKTIAHQTAKKVTYEVLNLSGLPIPLDLKDEIEGQDKESQ
jgi:hypothetical protein